MFCLGSWHDWRRMKIFLCIEKIINNGASEPPDNARQRSRLTLINPKKLQSILRRSETFANRVTSTSALYIALCVYCTAHVTWNVTSYSLLLL